MVCKTCKYPYAVKGNCPNCGSKLPEGITAGHWIMIILVILTGIGLFMLWGIKQDERRSYREESYSVPADSTATVTQEHETVSDELPSPAENVQEIPELPSDNLDNNSNDSYEENQDMEVDSSAVN